MKDLADALVRDLNAIEIGDGLDFSRRARYLLAALDEATRKARLEAMDSALATVKEHGYIALEKQIAKLRSNDQATKTRNS